jgi:hypothetical protein
MKKAKEGKIPAKKKKQIGVLVDTELWKEIKILAIREDRSEGEVLDEALRFYLKNRELIEKKSEAS